MGFEGISNKNVDKKESQHRFDDGMFDDTGFQEIVPTEENPDTLEAAEEYQQTVSNRLEAREFSKEHSQFYRDRLARDIRSKRRDLSDFLQGKKRDVEELELSHQETLNSLQSQISQRESEYVNRTEYKEKFELFKAEVSELEGELEAIKNSFWQRLFGKEKLAVLESKKHTLDAQASLLYEPDRERILELTKEIDEYKSQLENEKENSRSAHIISEIKEHSFFVQDSYVSEAKDLIKNFYDGNLELKRELENNPMSRDVAENCRAHGVLLRHGVPDPYEKRVDDPDWSGNNSVIDTKQLEASERLLFAASVQPALSTHTEVVSGGHMKQGFIVGGGEITAASKTDLFSYASNFDSRNPKYDRDIVSSYSPRIQESFAEAVEHAGDRQRSWNEIIVQHPEFSAIYTEDVGEYGKYTEEGHNLFYTKAKWALEQSAALGMPAVVILESGQIINIATDEEMTHEELLSKTVQHSPSERSLMFDAAIQQGGLQSEDNSQSQVQIEQRFNAFAEEFRVDPEMEEYKQINRELAQAKLDILEAEKIAANHAVREMWEREKKNQ